MSQASIVSNPNSFTSLSPLRAFNHYLPIQFESRIQENRWFLLFQSMEWLKPTVVSLAPHRETLLSLEIEPHVYALFERTGLDLDRVMNQPTYQKLVYEFLTSFEVYEADTRIQIQDEGAYFGENTVWKFRIQNTSFEWTRKHAISCLRLPEYGMFPKATENELTSFWEDISGLKEFNEEASPYSIDTKVWHYAHRIIATNINCVPETVDKVSKEDLELMWGMDEGEPLDWFRIFTIRFLKMGITNGQAYGAGRFSGCTSLITLIAKTCGFMFMSNHGEKKYLDTHMLRKLKLLARPIEIRHELTDVTEPTWEEEVNSNGPEHEEINNEEKEPSDKKRRIEIEGAFQMNDKVDWAKVSRVVVYEF